MAKVVTINGEILGLPGKKWDLIDSNNNVKKFIKNFTSWNEKLLEADDNVLVMTQLVVEEVPNILADMLSLSKTEQKQMDDSSFSDQYDIFREMARQFLGIELTGIKGDEEVVEDPKKLGAE
ncbi:hypothetical protein JEM51_11195 [Ligilactobacillus agilis]|uniref:hypothetical protein n=1 Tax=Ligilactobacillus agilis TaxID=1601 RepID=UPI00191F7157|nr:hypothetical protein [Ligilactobacillus agilis]MBL1056961.1 hypothetical protein [Ligilactobacillus agilis]MDM8279636.1 hypothetical protein [Ligilactobacillus agilis]